MLTKQQIDDYVAQKGLRCPYCGSVGHITAGTAIPDSETTQINQNMLCRMCKREWQDVYNLASIVPIELDTVAIPTIEKAGCDCVQPD